MVAENYTESDYKREITHKYYRHGSKQVKKGGLRGRLHNVITDKEKAVLEKLDVGEKEAYYYANDIFLKRGVDSELLPLWGGGFFLLLFVSFLLIITTSVEEVELSFILATSIFFLGFLFYIILPCPKKKTYSTGLMVC